MFGIFISYRRKDTAAGYAGRLRSDLKRELPDAEIFFDVESMARFIGKKFSVIIDEALSSCDVLLVMIGSQWAAITKEREHDERDWVRREIATALERDIKVVPLLVDGAAMPDDLPEDIADLAEYQAHDLAARTWDASVKVIVDMIKAGQAEKMEMPAREPESAPEPMPQLEATAALDDEQRVKRAMLDRIGMIPATKMSESEPESEPIPEPVFSEPTPAAPGLQVPDEDVQFTVYRPRVVLPKAWYQMLAFVHKSTMMEAVQDRAARRLGETASRYPVSTVDARQALLPGSVLRVAPAIPGIEFQPPSRTFVWREPLHEMPFLLRASADLDGRTARGVVPVYLGPLLIAEVTLSIRVDSADTTTLDYEGPDTDRFDLSRKIFVSYSHKDTEVIEWFESVASVVAVVTDDKFLRDVRILRAGEDWEVPIMRKIVEADVFQLFWSWNSMESKFVRQEWEYALGLERPHFVRPVYWHDPLPERVDEGLPPTELTQLQFRKLPSQVAAFPMGS